MAGFNLVERSWIPIVRMNGRPDRVGLLESLADSTAIREIAAGNPIDNVAILRYLVSVLMWCHPEVSTEKLLAASSCGGIPGAWLGPIGSLQDPDPLFDLRSGDRGHLQAPPDASGKRPVADLFHEVPAATNIAHLRHVTDFKDGVCLPCLAIGLVRLPAAITAYGQGKSPGINGTPPVYFTPIGRSLAETIALNIPGDRLAGDHPCWGSGHSKSADEKVGFLEGASWTSRQFRIRDVTAGRCMLCGVEVTELVSTLLESNTPNGRPTLTSSTLEAWRDPHVAYNKRGFPVRGIAADGNLLGGTRHWRDWLGALQGVHESSPPLAVANAMRFPDSLSRVDAIAMVTNKAKSVECVRISYPPDVVVAPNDSTARLAVRMKGLSEPKRSGLKPPHKKELPVSSRSSLAHESPHIEADAFRSVARSAAPQSVHSVETVAAALDRVARTTRPSGLLDMLEAQQRSILAADPATRDASKTSGEPKGRGKRRGAAS